MFLLAGTALLAGGCNKAENDGNQAGKGNDQKATEIAANSDDHSGWWCPEHGIPEEECSMCNVTVAAELKKSGDWCEKHDRAMSQCFICQPERKEVFAAKYRAKYGEEPPPVDE
jgi:hypothetical protein